MLTCLGQKSAGRNARLPHGIESLIDTAETPALLRNALTAMQEQGGIVVMAGPATNLARILDLPGVKDLISHKIKFLSVVAGDYAAGEPDFNIKSDLAAAKKLFAEWPTPIIAAGHEIGQALPYPGSSIEKDFAWSQNHPVVDAYRAYKPMPYDAPATDMAAVLYAVRPQETYFKLSEPGKISVRTTGGPSSRPRRMASIGT